MAVGGDPCEPLWDRTSRWLGRMTDGDVHRYDELRSELVRCLREHGQDVPFLLVDDLMPDEEVEA